MEPIFRDGGDTMATWRSLGVGMTLLLLTSRAWAQPYPLNETPQPGDCFKVNLVMKLAGELRVNRDGNKVPIPLSANAAFDFRERVLEVGPQGWPIKNARQYDQARASIAARGDKSERILRKDRSLIAAQRCKDQYLCYSPNGPLTREELDLVSEHLDTLAIAGLLPGKAVNIGETWKLTNPVAQSLCAFEGLINQDLTCKLESVTGDAAKVTVTGTASGIDLGAIVKLTVQARCDYSLKDKRIARLEWKQKDEREQGPVSPASALEATTTVVRQYLGEQPKELMDASLVGVPEGQDAPPAPFLLLHYREPKGAYSLDHTRDWHVTGQTDEHLTMRLMERGDFIAQVTVTPWHKAEPGKHMTPAEFREVMDETPGWESAGAAEEGELSSNDRPGYWTYRVSAVGELEGLKVMQNYYVVAGPDGNQVVLVYTMRQALAEKLGSRDVALTAGLELPAAKEEKK